MKSYAIFDLDNCLANDEWRIPRINWSKSDPDERYLDYHQLSPFDAPGNMAVLRAANEANGIIISTARPITFRAATAHWLQTHHIPFDVLLMRNRGDHRPSVQLKAVHLDWLSNYDIDISQVRVAFDDRPDVVEMYRQRGIADAEVLAIHDVCAYTKPE